MANFSNTYAPSAERQKTLDSYFGAEALYWKEIYRRTGVYEIIHQQRRSAVLALADELRLPLHAGVLEVGCGAGLTAVALARRGYTVHAVDPVEEMLELARQHAAEAHVADRVKIHLDNVNRLAFPDHYFSLVIAIGVLPWLDSVARGIRQIVRVTKPGGYLITNVDNRWRLHELLDPRLNPLHAGLRAWIKNLRASAKRQPFTQRCAPKEFDSLLEKVGYVKLAGRTLGFGPFSMLGFPVLPKSLGMKVHSTLQKYADRNVPVLRSTGAQYLVLARKRA